MADLTRLPSRRPHTADGSLALYAADLERRVRELELAGRGQTYNGTAHFHIDGSAGAAEATTTHTPVPGLTWTADKDYDSVHVFVAGRMTITSTGTGYLRVVARLNDVEKTRLLLADGDVATDHVQTGTWLFEDVIAGDVIDVVAWRDGTGGAYTAMASQHRMEIIASAAGGVPGPTGAQGPAGPLPTYASAAARGAGSGRPEGYTCYVQDVNQFQMWDGTGWLAWDPGMVDYTPTLTNLTVGSGGNVLARYQRRWKRMLTDFSFVYGTGSSVGTTPTVSLPVSMADPHGMAAIASIGRASLLDAPSTAQVDGLVRLAGGGTTYTIHAAAASGSWVAAQTITSSNPWTWASPDRIHVLPFEYDMASYYVS